MNKSISAILVLMIFSAPVLPVLAQGGSDKAPSVNPADADNDGIPVNAEQLLGTNPYSADTDGDGIVDSADDQPLDFGTIPLSSDTTQLPLTLTDARVEDNYRADDHLEITLKNNGSVSVSLNECYITISDKGSNAQERYLVDMGGFPIAPGSKQTFHFDNGQAAGHFPGNINGLYRTGADGLIFDVSIRSTGFKPVEISVEKAPGTAEIAD